MPVVNQDNHYSTHFQEIRPLHNIVHVLPVSILLGVELEHHIYHIFFLTLI